VLCVLAFKKKEVNKLRRWAKGTKGKVTKKYKKE
jgi:hypothetical protein